jgi:NTE family protein
MPFHAPRLSTPAHRPFTLVLAGGGARGFAHVGALRALEADGYHPSAIVGVSMGAAVSVGYGLREDWYAALLAMDTGAFPAPMPTAEQQRDSLRQRLRARRLSLQFAYRLLTGWGIGTPAREAGLRALRTLTLNKGLEDARLPVAVSTTDLRGGRRHVIRTGDAAEAVYASVALAGVLPPLDRDGLLLADGAYADLAPVGVARGMGHPVVIAVNPGQALATAEISNGLQALRRATEVCSLSHAAAGFEQADCVLRPTFRRTIDTLDFAARRECAAAGVRVVRTHRTALAALLNPEAPTLPPGSVSTHHLVPQHGLAR